jgi:hypothetical protein
MWTMGETSIHFHVFVEIWERKRIFFCFLVFWFFGFCFYFWGWMWSNVNSVAQSRINLISPTLKTSRQMWTIVKQLKTLQFGAKNSTEDILLTMARIDRRSCFWHAKAISIWCYTPADLRNRPHPLQIHSLMLLYRPSAIHFNWEQQFKRVWLAVILHNIIKENRSDDADDYRFFFNWNN